MILREISVQVQLVQSFAKKEEKTTWKAVMDTCVLMSKNFPDISGPRQSCAFIVEIHDKFAERTSRKPRICPCPPQKSNVLVSVSSRTLSLSSLGNHSSHTGMMWSTLCVVCGRVLRSLMGKRDQTGTSAFHNRDLDQ